MAYFVFIGSVVIFKTSLYESLLSNFSTALGNGHYLSLMSWRSRCNQSSYSLTVWKVIQVLGFHSSLVYQTSLVKVRFPCLFLGIFPLTLVIIGLHSSMPRWTLLNFSTFGSISSHGFEVSLNETTLKIGFLER